MIAHEGEQSCFKLVGRSTYKLPSSMTLHHLPPQSSCSLKQGGENVVFSSPRRGRSIHQHLSDAMASPAAQKEGTACSHSISKTAVPGKQRCPWACATEGSKETTASIPAENSPAGTRGLTAHRTHTNCAPGSPVQEISNRLHKLLPGMKLF